MIPAIPIKAEMGEKYPYTLFTGSSDIGAITVNADNFCVNGNIATNGTVVTSGDINIHGNKIENAGLEILYISKKLDSIYFTGNNVELYQENYSCEKMNMEINTPVNAGGELKLIGNLDLKTGIKALGDISLTGEVINSKDSVVYEYFSLDVHAVR